MLATGGAQVSLYVLGAGHRRRNAVMAESLRLLEVFAHPDDESYGTGGTLAKYSAAGVSTYLVSATRGEAGEILDPAMVSISNLALVREGELRAAAAILGVKEVHFLDYLDGSLDQADPLGVEEKVVRLIRKLRPHVLVTFGPKGVYGHPDHIAIHRATANAYCSAADPASFPGHYFEGLTPHVTQRLYYSDFPSGKAKLLSDAYAEMGMSSIADWYNPSHFGVPDEQITTVVDVRGFVQLKEQALRLHRTQTGPKGPFADLAQALRTELMGSEYFILAHAAAQLYGLNNGHDLFAGIS
jgi:LmbE family N-acetylglucosaminyl deacetylase